ncbi:MAG: phage virion morphogenesis protein [Acidobacteria bacterium]|nr:phage virion morphogenesis protein [Acidobacteriota bacterium]
MIEFTYSINSQPVEKALANFQASLANQSPALKQIADDFREMIARQFASEGRAEGTPWAPRHHPSVPSSLRRGIPIRSGGVVKTRPGQAQGLPLLVRTGALLRSLTAPGAAGHVERFEDHSLAIGTSLPYALFHQTGTRRMPARPIIVLSGARSERWVEIVRDGIEEKARLLGEKELGGAKL